MMLVEDGHGDPPDDAHYRFRQTGMGEEQRRAGEEYLRRQGCTKVVHYRADPVLISVGYVEPIDVVRRRAREPRYD